LYLSFYLLLNSPPGVQNIELIGHIAYFSFL